MAKTFSSEGVVLKRRNYGEADRMVTIYTRSQGKVTAMAKGVRKMASKKKGGLEPGMVSKCFFAETRGMPILTQVEIVDNYSGSNDNLTNMTQTFQILEVVDNLTPDNQANEEVYDLLVGTLKLLKVNGSKKEKLLDNIRSIIKSLGFGPPDNLDELGLKDYIENVAERRLKSKKFLTPETLKVA